jgi:hypothetical protein
MNLLRLAFIVALFQGAPPPAPPRPTAPPTGSASVEGVVVKTGTNEPIAGVDIELTIQPLLGGPQSPPYAATSGADGKYVFRNVAAGNYKLVAARIGGSYVPVEYGQRGVIGRGVLFAVGEGEQKKDLRLEMAPVGSITGRILDADNRPMGHVAVMAFSAIYRQGDRLVTMLELVHSDDHGEYRLFSLTPGRYYVAARLEDLTRRTVPLGYYPPGRMFASDRSESPIVTKRRLPAGEEVEETYQIVYYGGGINPDLASPVDVGIGSNVAGIDIPMAEARVPSRHIRGKVAVSGNLPAPARLTAVPQRYTSDMLTPVGLTDADGAFDLGGAVPGKYYLVALVPPDPNIRTTPPPQPQVGVLSIEVGESDLDGVSMVVSAPFLITGKVSMENRQESDPDLAKLSVDFTPEPYVQGFPNLNSTATVFPNGGFSTNSLRQGDFFPQVNGLPPYAYTKSIRIGARDLMLNPLRVDNQMEGRVEIILGTDPATLTGHVVDDRQQPAQNVKVALVPDAPLRRRWDLYKSGATDQSGNFTFRGIPPGDYEVFAWEQVDDNIWTIPEFLRNDEGRGKPVHIGSSANEKTEMNVIPAPKSR